MVRSASVRSAPEGRQQVVRRQARRLRQARARTGAAAGKDAFTRLCTRSLTGNGCSTGTLCRGTSLLMRVTAA